MKYYYCFLLIIILNNNSFSQFGGHRYRTDWKSIETDKTTVIFDSLQEENAIRIKTIIYNIQNNKKSTLGLNKYHINLLLHPENASFNGFVSTYPWRSEFFSIAPPNMAYLGSIDWLDALTIHEYRHVIQNSTARKGLTKIAATIFGDIGWSSAHIVIPTWFWEGDAIWFETATTRNGRGRSPNFYNIFRETAFRDLNFKYNLIRSGSYNQQTPSPYLHGYILTEYLRNQHDNTIWQPIVEASGAYKGFFFPFQRSIKKNTGMRLKNLNEAAIKSFVDNQKKLLNRRKKSSYTNLKHNKKRTVTAYYCPLVDKQTNNIYAIKRGYAYDARIIEIFKSGAEQKIVRIGRNITNEFTQKEGVFIWSETIPNIRRNNLVYNQIVIYNSKNKTKKFINNNTNYFSPNFHPTKKEFVSIESTKKIENYLIRMDLEGQVIDKVSYKPLTQLMHPVYGDNNKIYTLLKDRGKVAIMSYDIVLQKWEKITNFTTNILGKLFYKNEKLYFSASLEGIDDIYSLNLLNNEITKIAANENGLYFPFITSDNQLLTSAFTYKGNDLRLTKSSDFINKKIEQFPENSALIYESKTFENVDIVNEIAHETNEKTAIKPYKSLSKIFNFHSWTPYFYGNTVTASIVSQNLLNNTQISASYNYNILEKEGYYGFNYYYGGFYPVLSLSAFNSPYSSATYINKESKKVRYSYSYNRINPQISIPLNLSKGSGWFQYLTPRLGSNIYFGKYNNEALSSFNHLTFNPSLTYSIRSSYKRKAILPTWGLQFYSQFQKDINFSNQHYDATLSLLLPGFMKHHNLIISGSYINRQFDAKEPLRFNNNYLGSYFENPSEISNAFVARIKYHAPIWHPDWGIGNSLFFRRVRIAPFAEYSSANEYQYEYNSIGLDLTTDLVLFNLIPFPIGIRTGYYKSNSTAAQKWKIDYQFVFEIPLYNSGIKMRKGFR